MDGEGVIVGENDARFGKKGRFGKLVVWRYEGRGGRGEGKEGGRGGVDAPLRESWGG